MAKLVELEVSYGVTIVKDGVYFKPNASARIELDSEDTAEKRKLVWKQAWEMVEGEVAKQIKGLD